MTDTVHHEGDTHCPYCALQCGMSLVAEHGRLVVAPRDFPTNKGGLCRKGFTAAELLDARDRLTEPLVREHKGGALLAVSWDQALDRIVAGLRAIQAASGPDAIGVFGGGGLTNEKAYMLGKFARVALRTANIDYNGRFCMASAAAAGLRAFGIDRGLPFPLRDIPGAEAVLLVGGNPADTMPPLMQYFEDQRRRGGKLIVVDPRRSATAKLASLHLQITPGTDAALANGLLNVAINRRLIDDEFITMRTAGFDRVRRMVASYWPDRVERITGVPARKIEEAAHIMGQAATAMVLTGRGPEQQSHGVDNVLAFINLALALGKAGKPFCGYGCLTGQGNGQGGREHGQKADQLPGYRRLDNPRHRIEIAAIWGIDPDDLPRPGLSAAEMLAALGTSIRGLLVFASNVAISAPAAEQLGARLDALDMLVVADLFLSETAAQADVVLPVAQWAEEEGTMTNLEGRVLLRRRVRAPPQGVWTDAQVLEALADRLGAGRHFTADTRATFDEFRRATAGGAADYAGVTYERIVREDGVFWPCPSESHPGTPRLFFERFGTDDGRARFHPVEYLQPAEVPDADYPYFLTTGRVLAQYQSGTQTRRVKELAKAEPEAVAEIHPDTAQSLGIGTGDKIRLTTRRGRAVMKARLTPDIRLDTVFAPFHWGAGGNANALTNPALDPVSRIPEFKVCAVRVEKVTASGLAPAPGARVDVLPVSRTMQMSKQKLVVVGNGMAGARAVEEVLARGRDRFDIVMFGEEPYGNYNRILLSSILSGAQDASEIFINPLEWYEENHIKLHAGARVGEIDRSAKIVTSESGISERFDKLLIATGSRAFIPPMAGVNLPDGRIKPGLFGFRTIDDCSAIVLKAKQSRRAAVIGGGLLGLEAARGLLNHGCEVHVVHLVGHLMETQLDPTGGAILRSSMEAMGVNVHLEKLTCEVLGEDRVTGLGFKDGTTLDCDMVVVAAGIKPNAEIGRRCGLTVKRAIVVDDHMRSVDDPDVYAVGECAEHRGRVYGLVAPLWDQAKVFADHVTGRDPDAAYHGSKLATKLKVMGVELASMGIIEPAEERDEIIQYTEAKRGTYKKLIVRDGRLVGGILMGDISKAAYLMQCFDRDALLPDERPSLLFDLGSATRRLTADEMPADMMVCNCNGVFKGAIAAAFADGMHEAAAIMKATRAGGGCGSCKDLVREIVAWMGSQAEAEPAIAATASAPAYIDRAAARDGVDGAIWVPPDVRAFTPAEFERIAEVALKHNVVRIGLDAGGRLDIVGVARPSGLPANREVSRLERACRSCVGVDHCRFGQGDSMGLAAKIERRFDDRPSRLSVATAGCARNCPEAQTADIGAVAMGDGSWEVYVGGADGPAPRKGHVLCIADDEEDVLSSIGRFIALYRAEATDGESAACLIERVGIERLRMMIGDGAAPGWGAAVAEPVGAGLIARPG